MDEIRPYLIADGGNVALHEIDGNVVKLKLQGACGSCPSAVTTMKLGIERRLMENIPEIVAVESIPDEETGLELNEENIEMVIDLLPFLFFPSIKINILFPCIMVYLDLVYFLRISRYYLSFDNKNNVIESFRNFPTIDYYLVS